MEELKFRMFYEGHMYEVEVLDLKNKRAYMKDYKKYTQSWIPFEKIQLMQYTDSHDENGIEIYTGDIVEVTRPCVFERGIVVSKSGCHFIKAGDTLLPLYQCAINDFKLKRIRKYIRK